MEHKYIIQSIDLDDVMINNKIKYNSNNHWENDLKPLDYLEKIENGNTSKWIDLFKPNYKKIIMSNESDIRWIKLAFQIGKQTGKFPKSFSDELEQTVQELELKYPNTFDSFKISNNLVQTNASIGYFVRTENVSLKYGVHGIGPYYDFKSIIESIVTTTNSHTPIYPNTDTINLYLIPWANISESDEFRVFVNHNKITAISQQNIYSKLYDHIEIKKLDKIVEYFNSNIKPKITWMNSYTYDFAFTKINNEIITQPYFIEPNSFGKEYAAGSALFHWILDEQILYGLNNNDNNNNNDNTIYVRHTI